MKAAEVVIIQEIDKITGKTCKKTRQLWEEVFYEDSRQFTDYYFQNKADKNIGYVIGKETFDAMMFRTPYQIQIGKIQKELSYIVGVATRKECRHRGYMRNLLLYSFKKMYEKKQPFTFLMPANPAIYEPFDFKYIYERDVWELKDAQNKITRLEALTESDIAVSWKCEEDYKLTGLYSVTNLRKQMPGLPITDMLANFANEYLKDNYNIYVYRDSSYYDMQIKESNAQNGDIYVLFENGEIKAFFLYAREEKEVFIQEVIEAEEGILDFLQKTDKKKPIIMARIIHLEEMLKLVCSKEYKKVILKIEDELIHENAGVYEWEITSNGSYVTKLQQGICTEEVIEKKVEEIKKQNGEYKVVSMHIRDIAPYILTGVFLNEIV